MTKQHIYRLLHTTKQYICCGGRWFYNLLKRAFGWSYSGTQHLLNEFGDPVTCVACHWVGVILHMTLPPGLFFGVIPDLSNEYWLFATIAIAIGVFRLGGEKRWEESQGKLGKKMFQACGDGIFWPYIWLIQKVKFLVGRSK